MEFRNCTGKRAGQYIKTRSVYYVYSTKRPHFALILGGTHMKPDALDVLYAGLEAREGRGLSYRDR